MLIKYRAAIYNFEKDLEDLYLEKNNNKENEGYLIDFIEYEIIKKEIDYSNKENKLYLKNMESIHLDESEKFFKIHQINFKTSQFLINMILNKNKYIIINSDLWKILCDKDEENENPIKYKINNNDIILKLDNIELSFNILFGPKNVIDKFSYNDFCYYKSNYEQIETIYNDIIKYYKFEKLIINNLKNNNLGNQNDGYLLRNEWIDKWKKYSSYIYIKNNYLDKDINDDNILKNNLIYYLEENRFEYNELQNTLDIMIFKNKEEFDSFLENDSLGLLNLDFVTSFNSNYSNRNTKYNTINNTIYIYLDNQTIKFKTDNNIISSNENNYYIHLKQLIKIFFFQKEFHRKIHYQHQTFSNNENNINNNYIYLINKKFINIYKNIFEYVKLFDLLNNINNIIYENFENNYSKIIDELENNYINEIKKKKISNKFKQIDVDNFNELSYEINESSKRYLKYIINFEIINEDIKNFFIKNKIIKENQIILGLYLAENGKILIFLKNRIIIFMN